VSASGRSAGEAIASARVMMPKEMFIRMRIVVRLILRAPG
jgi:hypothetical protein